MLEKTLCIVGIGSVGGSLAASVKSRGLPWRVRAADRRRRTLDVALRRGMADEVLDDVAAAVRGVELVLLAVPVSEIRRLLERLGPTLEAGQVVTDVGSTKASIVAQAEESLPEGVAFVGGHPIVGTPRSGVDSAVAGLFEGRMCMLTPTEATPRSALEAVTGLWVGVGAEVRLVDPTLHDGILARLSHLPNMIAFTLLRSVASRLSVADLEMAGGSLQDYTRVTQSPVALWRDICLENRVAIGEALDEFVDQLHELRAAVASGDRRAVEEFLRDAVQARGHVWPA